MAAERVAARGLLSPAGVGSLLPEHLESRADHRKPLFNLLTRTRQHALKNNGQDMATIWSEMVEQDFREVVRNIHIPALIVGGAQSQLYGLAACEWLESAMPNARSSVFEHSGHAPHLEEPELFNKTLSRFVDEVSS